MEITRKIVKQPFAPDTTDVLWLDSSGDSDVLKSFCNGQWKETSTPQQDYIVIKTSQKRYFQDDAEAMSKIAGAISRNTLFDCLIENIDDAAVTYYFRPVGYMPEDKIFYYYDAANGGMEGMDIPYSESQYQGLAVVQAEVDRIDSGVPSNLPSLTTYDDFLYEAGSTYRICTPEGYQYKVTLVEGKVATIEASTTKGKGDFIAISIEDAQKLIGLPIMVKR